MTTTQTTTGFSGLTARQIVTQSWLCHPDWSLDTHQGYLASEEGLDVDLASIAAWITMAQATAAAHERAAAQEAQHEYERTHPVRRGNRPAGGTRPNRYAGTCRVCGENVPANDGILVGRPGSWAVEHATPEACQQAEDKAEERGNEPVPVTPARYSPSEGEFHLVAGVLYRVQKSRGDNLYAKAATIVFRGCGCPAQLDSAAGGCPAHKGEARLNIEWEYVGKRPFRSFSQDTLLTWEQARDLGTLTSRCIRCGRELGGETNESEIRSVAAGYGETCAGHMGWWYPTLDEARQILADRTRR